MLVVMLGIDGSINPVDPFAVTTGKPTGAVIPANEAGGKPTGSGLGLVKAGSGPGAGRDIGNWGMPAVKGGNEPNAPVAVIGGKDTGG